MLDKNKQNELKEQITQPIQNEWLNPNDMKIEYKFSISTLAKWRMKNINLPYSKIGKYIKYKRSDVETFLNANIVDVEVA